jgi:hypothetical protein
MSRQSPSSQWHNMGDNTFIVIDSSKSVRSDVSVAVAVNNGRVAGRDAVYSGRYLLAFQRNVLPLYREQKTSMRS